MRGAPRRLKGILVTGELESERPPSVASLIGVIIPLVDHLVRDTRMPQIIHFKDLPQLVDTVRLFSFAPAGESGFVSRRCISR